MTTPTVDQDRRRMLRLADIAEGLSGDVWHQVHSDGRAGILRRGADGAEELIVTFGAAASPDEIDIIAGALDDLMLSFRTRSRAVEERNRLMAIIEQGSAGAGTAASTAEKPAEPEAERDYAANAAMTLSEQSFWKYLAEHTPGGAITSREQADFRLKTELQIDSKKKLNTNRRAQNAWVHLRNSYQFWMRGT